MDKKTICLIAAVFAVLFGFSYSFAASAGTPGVTDTEITIGFSMVLSGPIGFIGGQAAEATESCFNKYNDQGGINGRKLKLVKYDSTMEVAQDIANYKKLILQDKVFCCVFGMWTSLSAVYPIIEENKVPWMFPMGPPAEMVFPPKRYLFNLFPTHLTQVKAIGKWLKDQNKWHKVAVVYANNEAGKAGLRDFKQVLEGSKINVVASEAIEEGAVSFAVQTAKLRMSNPDLVFLVGMTHAPAALAIKEGKQKGWDVQFLTYNPVSGYVLLSLLKDVEVKGLMGSFWGKMYNPNYDDPDSYTKEMVAAKNTILKYFPKAANIDGTIEHYLNVELLVEALKRAGRDLTREKLIQAMESFKNYDNGKGGLVTFSPTRREGLGGGVILEAVDHQKWKVISNWIDVKID
jgi:branched-chain amino acid transport system substrate-binding protein